MLPSWYNFTMILLGTFFISSFPQCISIAGLTLLVVQLTIYSPLIKAAGIQRSNRVSSFVMVPIFVATPLLSLLHNSGWVLTVANLVMLFLHNIAANTVSDPLASQQCSNHPGGCLFFIFKRPYQAQKRFKEVINCIPFASEYWLNINEIGFTGCPRRMRFHSCLSIVKMIISKAM